MRYARLRRLAEAYGADLGRWPRSERAAAERLLARSPKARALLDEAGRLDGLLDRFDPVAAEPPFGPALDLPAALPAQDRPRMRQEPRGFAPRENRQFWFRAATLAMASVVGVLIGLSDLGERIAGQGSPESNTVTAILYGDPMGGLEL